MARIKMHIPKAQLPFYPPCEVKCRLQNWVSTTSHLRISQSTTFYCGSYGGFLIIALDFFFFGCVDVGWVSWVVMGWCWWVMAVGVGWFWWFGWFWILVMVVGGSGLVGWFWVLVMVVGGGELWWWWWCLIGSGGGGLCSIYYCFLKFFLKKMLF